jgi:hypothetical protein
MRTVYTELLPKGLTIALEDHTIYVGIKKAMISNTKITEAVPIN